MGHVGHCELTEQESTEPSPAWNRWINQKPESQEKKQKTRGMFTDHRERKLISEMVQIKKGTDYFILLLTFSPKNVLCIFKSWIFQVFEKIKRSDTFWNHRHWFWGRQEMSDKRAEKKAAWCKWTDTLHSVRFIISTSEKKHSVPFHEHAPGIQLREDRIS